MTSILDIIIDTFGTISDVVLELFKDLEDHLEDLKEIVESIDDDLASKEARISRIEDELDNSVRCLREDIAELRKRLDDHTNYMSKVGINWHEVGKE